LLFAAARITHCAGERLSSKGEKKKKKPASKQDSYLGPQKIAQPGCYYTQGTLRHLGLIIGNRAVTINFGESMIKH